MNTYKFNCDCSCERCHRHGLMGPTVMVTLGLLFLVGNFTRFDFGDLWPILLIVIGFVLVARSNASAQGHVPVGALPSPPAASPSTFDREVKHE